MLQDMLPLPQLCPECQMLARVPASASATSATSATILGLLRPPANRGPGGSPPPMGGEAASWPPQPANHRPALTSPGWPGSFGLCCNLHLFSGHLHCSSCFLCFGHFPVHGTKDCLMFNLEYLCDSYATVNHTKVEMETIPINITPNVQQSVQKMSVLC